MFSADLGPPSSKDNWKVRLNVQLLVGMQLGLSMRQVQREMKGCGEGHREREGERITHRKDVSLS